MYGTSSIMLAEQKEQVTICVLQKDLNGMWKLVVINPLWEIKGVGSDEVATHCSVLSPHWTNIQESCWV